MPIRSMALSDLRRGVGLGDPKTSRHNTGSYDRQGQASEGNFVDTTPVGNLST
jgi:hypothetical protein